MRARAANIGLLSGIALSSDLVLVCEVRGNKARLVHELCAMGRDFLLPHLQCEDEMAGGMLCMLRRCSYGGLRNTRGGQGGGCEFMLAGRRHSAVLGVA